MWQKRHLPTSAVVALAILYWMQYCIGQLVAKSVANILYKNDCSTTARAHFCSYGLTTHSSQVSTNPYNYCPNSIWKNSANHPISDLPITLRSGKKVVGLLVPCCRFIYTNPTAYSAIAPLIARGAAE